MKPVDMAREIVSRLFTDGMIVNLGVGLPQYCSEVIPEDLEVVLHAEQGLVGFGAMLKDPQRIDASVTNASMIPVEPKPGMAYLDLLTSFALIRGGRLDMSVMGAMEVSWRGDLANHWLSGRPTGGVGGAQDLGCSAKSVVAMMEHFSPSGGSRIVPELSLPMTAPRCVDFIVTEIAFIAVRPAGLVILDTFDGWTSESVMDVTGPELFATSEQRLDVAGA